jgi:hypothetical protein
MSYSLKGDFLFLFELVEVLHGVDNDYHVGL